MTERFLLLKIEQRLSEDEKQLPQEISVDKKFLLIKIQQRSSEDEKQLRQEISLDRRLAFLELKNLELKNL